MKRRSPSGSLSADRSEERPRQASACPPGSGPAAPSSASVAPQKANTASARLPPVEISRF